MTFGRKPPNTFQSAHKAGLSDPPLERAPSDGDTRTQAEKFEAAARELGCDPNEDRFKDVLRKLVKPKHTEAQ